MYSSMDVLNFIAFHTPNFEHPQVHGDALFAVTLSLAICATLAVGLRVFGRIRCGVKLGLDDLFIIAAMVPVIGLAVVTILGVKKYGWDRHIYDIPPNLTQPNAKIAYVAKLLFIIAGTLIRESFLYLYAHMREGIRTRSFNITKYMLHAANILVGMVGLFLQATICQPLSLNWSFTTKDSASCRPEALITFIHGAIFCVLDLAICILPLAILNKLQMPRRRFKGVLILLACGVVVSAVSAVRNYFVYKSLMAEKDQTWYGYYLWLTVNMEVSLGVICACVPTLRILLMPSAKAQEQARLRLTYFDSERGLNSRDSAGSGAPLTTPERAAFTDTYRELPLITDDGEIVGPACTRAESGGWYPFDSRSSLNRDF